MVDTHVPLMMEWEQAAFAVGWMISSLTMFDDCVIVSARRVARVGSQGASGGGPIHTVAFGRVADHDVMMDALKTALRLEGA